MAKYLVWCPKTEQEKDGVVIDAHEANRAVCKWANEYLISSPITLNARAVNRPSELYEMTVNRELVSVYTAWARTAEDEEKRETN